MINKAIVVGNLGQDITARYTSAGAAVVNFSVATTEYWNDKSSGVRKEKTEWHNVVIFGKLAEIAAEYGKKGRQVYVEGPSYTRVWEDTAGVKRYTKEIHATEWKLTGNKNSASTDNHLPQGAPAVDQGYNGQSDGIPFDDDFPG